MEGSDLFSSNDLFIINGRLGQDYINPKFTCKDCSTIDYFICSPNMTQYMLVFNVLEFSPLFSDSHCEIELKMDVQYYDNVLKITENNIKTEKVISWNRPFSHCKFSSSLRLLGNTYR